MDYSTLFAAAAIAAVGLAAMIFGACLVLRQAGYLATLASAILAIGASCAALFFYRLNGETWLGLVTIVGISLCFLLIHLAMSQYVGKSGVLVLQWSMLPAMALSCVVYAIGWDGLAFIICFLATSALLIDTSLLYWSHRREVPFLMHGLAVMGASTAALFVMRAYAIAIAGQWAIGAAPDNWAENLTSIMSISYITAFGPIIVALHHVRDRVALISDAVTDPLTGLLNRRALLDRFEDADFSPDFAVVMFDLDHFKRTNDVFGHQVGDSVLRRFGYVASQFEDAHMTAFRLGGEEFALVFTEGGIGRARDMAERIAVTFAAEVVHTPLGPLRSTVSGGLAAGSSGVTKLSDVLALADAALYEAKRGGRNRVVVGSHAGAVVAGKARVA